LRDLCKKGIKVKKNLHIVYSWLLLICFIAGQYMVYTHQHLLIKGVSDKTTCTNTKDYSPAKDHSQQTVKEKCYMCDAMYHQAAIINTPFHFSPQVAAFHFFMPVTYNFVNLGLVLAAGRAPPVLS
jgi:hypothetical protein